MLNLRPTKPPNSLNGSNTSTNRSMIFYIKPMLSTNCAMINTEFHTSFRWGSDSNPWVPLMLHYLLQPHRKILPMFILRPTKPPNSLREFSTSTNMSMIFCRKQMLGTRSTMINIGCHTRFKWETRFGCIWRRRVLQDPIGSFVHFVMVLTPSPRLWLTMILS
jgi:hypothetical protein